MRSNEEEKMRKHLQRLFVFCLSAVLSMAVLAGCGSAAAGASSENISETTQSGGTAPESSQGEDASPADRAELLKQIEEKIQSMEATLGSMEEQADDAQGALVADLQGQIDSLKETAALLRDSIEEK